MDDDITAAIQYAVAIAGVAIALFGIGLIYVPAAVILAGLLITAGALLYDPEGTP